MWKRMIHYADEMVFITYSWIREQARWDIGLVLSFSSSSSSFFCTFINFNFVSVDDDLTLKNKA